MKTRPTYNIGTSVSVSRQTVLDYFQPYIDTKIEDGKHETYHCIDGSMLRLEPGPIDGHVFVKFHCHLQVDTVQRSISFDGKTWFLLFCKQVGSGIQNLRTKVVMQASDGALMSDLFSSEAFRIASHAASHPKDSAKDSD